jgi:predicted transcriptional regulator
VVRCAILGQVDLSAPYSPFLSATDAQVLSALAGTTRPMSGREIARLVGMAQTGVWRTLQRLTEHGLVNEEAAGGRTFLYTLNREHLATDAVISLTRLRLALIERIKKQVEPWPLQPTHASIFGSAARGDGDTKSDIDIFVVRPRGIDEEDTQWRKQLNDLADSVLRWTGNHAGVADVAQKEIPRLKRERPPIVGEIEKDGVLLTGTAIKSLFAVRRR